ncbi:hypothetical protein [Rubrivirga marina]|uniref:Adhesin domain-containing protein n=1 Tax=Rubrivirga marina TaxID=1196024 RepID=A0A271J4F7_9BACT|nr:hypothetical protein [Rubrivirga marina]PAP78167.1 hypothetical protein BSZ37_17880 [Rubrivirga marina]
MRLLLLFPLVAAAACAQPARVLPTDDWCDRAGTWQGVRACEVRETMTRADALDLQVLNGSLEVKEWDRSDVLVRARITAGAKTQADADRAVRETVIEVDGGSVRAEPGWAGDSQASVSYEIFAPRDTDLDLVATNGPISVHGMNGRIRVTATNGPVFAHDLSGDVEVNATNGPVEVDLGGSVWRGTGLNVMAHNGPITLSVPRDYSARLAAKTNHASISADGVRYAETNRRRGRYTGDQLEATLGRGGPLLSLEAYNGPVRLRAGG